MIAAGSSSHIFNTKLWDPDLAGDKLIVSIGFYSS